MIDRLEGTIKILYIGGYARSGSTLLARVLGEAPGMVCVGETRFLWSRGLINNVDCGCGRPFRSCPFWSAVGEEAFGGWDKVDAEHLTEVDRVTNLPQSLPLHWMPWMRPGMKERIAEYTTYLERLYRAIAHVSDAKMIIEMSKDPTFACLLRRTPDSDVRVVHLVRDSRAVAYSWGRTRQMPSPIGEQVLMPQEGPIETAIKWSTWNVGCYALSATGFPYFKMTYESFVADPGAVLDRLGAFAGEPLHQDDSRLRDKEVKLGDHHIFSGNPMRASTGWMPIRLDNEWQTAMTSGQFRKVTAITWPLLRLNGYPTVPQARRSSGSAAAGASER